ncbi:MAG: hypothetical protein HKO71_00015, partial [Pseudomonadales bacterium]|nr:hypothetical protein [Pseudomonadales bacterium]
MSAPSQASAFVTIDLANHLIASVLILLALGILRSKKSRSESNSALQLLCFATLIMQLAATAVSLQYTHQPLYAVALLGSASLWVLALLKLIETGLRRPLSGWVRLIALCVMGAAAVALFLSANSTSTNTQMHGLQVLFYGIYPPLLLIALMSGYALRIDNAKFQGDCRLFLLGSLLFVGLELLHVFFELTFSSKVTTLAYFHGFLSAIIALLFVIGSVRHTPAQSFLLSRTVIFFSSVALPLLLLVGFFFIASSFISDADLYWGTAAQLVLVVGALVAIYSLSMSIQFRDKIRVFVNKNFFRHKYDYRNVWLNLIQTLSSISDDREFFRLGLQAVGEIFDAKGGAMWLRNTSDEFELVPTWNLAIDQQEKITLEDKFIQPFIKEEWIYALALSGKQEHDRHLKHIPDWMRELDHVWIIAPLLVGKR